MRAYWDRLYSTLPPDHPDRLTAVCLPGLSLFANRLIDRLHRRAFRAHLPAGAPGRSLDVGCGGGRWVRRLRGSGWRAYGVDLSPFAFRHLAPPERRTLAGASGTSLPFGPAAFDLVTDVTVIQHVDYGQQERMGDEIRRVLRPGGHWLLLEHLTPPGLRAADVRWEGMYPRSLPEWEEFVTGRGFTLLRSGRCHYLPWTQRCLNWLAGFDRAYQRLKKAVAPGPAPASAPAAPAAIRPPSWRLRFFRGFQRHFLDLAVAFDYFFSRPWETTRGSHVVLLARKD